MYINTLKRQLGIRIFVIKVIFSKKKNTCDKSQLGVGFFGFFGGRGCQMMYLSLLSFFFITIILPYMLIEVGPIMFNSRLSFSDFFYNFLLMQKSFS